MKRREFLATLGTAALGSGVLSVSKNVSGQEMKTKEGPLPRRPYGKTGERLSIIGFSGLLLNYLDQEESNQIVREACEKGVNFFDVAPMYGQAQDRLGPALEPFRKNVFLSCKTTKRKKGEFLQEMQESLKKLRTDHFDLYQLHALIKKEDVEEAFAPGGAVEALDKIKQEGLARFVGFSSHNVECALAALNYYNFDSVLFPINFVSWYHGNMGEQVVEFAISKGVAVLAMKTLARSPWPEGMEKPHKKWWYRPIEDAEETSLALRFTLSQSVTTAMPPMDATIFRRALAFAPSFIPLSEEEKEKLKQRAMQIEPLFTYPSKDFDVIKKA